MNPTGAAAAPLREIRDARRPALQDERAGLDVQRAESRGRIVGSRSRCSAPPWRQAWLEVEPLIVVLPGLLAHLRIRRRIR